MDKHGKGREVERSGATGGLLVDLVGVVGPIGNLPSLGHN